MKIVITELTSRFAPCREEYEPILLAFCRTHGASTIYIREVLGGGRSGNLVLSVEFGNEPSGGDNTFRVLKIGSHDVLSKEYNGFKTFDKRGSRYFCSIEELWCPEGDSMQGVLVYQDEMIKSGSFSLKGVSDYVLTHYELSRDRDFDPKLLSEYLGDVMSRLFRDLKANVYRATVEHGAGEVLRETVRNAFTLERLKSLDPAANEARYIELLSMAMSDDTHYLAVNIHGDMNPNNVLLSIEEDASVINDAALIDYGETVDKREKGFTYVFWDLARLTGELLLDFSEHTGLADERGRDNCLACGRDVLQGLFGSGDRCSLRGGQWEFLFHMLFRIFDAFFLAKGGHPENDIYRSGEAVVSFMGVLQSFFLFYTRYEGEPPGKRLFGIELIPVIERLKQGFDFGSWERQVAELKRMEVITRLDSRRVYEDLTGGKFRHLKSIDRLILSKFAQGEEERREYEPFPVMVNHETGDGGKGEYFLYEKVIALRSERKRHLLLVGEGGMGKTVALMQLFELLTGRSGPIPLFLELQDINRAAIGTDVTNYNWVLDRLVCDYTGKGESSGEERKQLSDLFTGSESTPHYLLLLDGYNEVSTHHGHLQNCIERLCGFKNLMIVITSRDDIRARNQALFGAFEMLRLTGLSEEQARHYLGERPWSEELAYRGVLKNPLYLCFYRDSAAITGRYADARYSFYQNPSSSAEILHNFMEYTRARWQEEVHRHQDEWQGTELRLCFEYVLPEIGCRMERAGKWELDAGEMRELLDEIHPRLFSPDAEDALEREGYNPEHIEAMREGPCETPAKFRRRLLAETLTGHVVILRKKTVKSETGSVVIELYSFVHQDLRDYFAAVYLKRALEKDAAALGTLLRNRVLPGYLARMLGELCLEHRRAPKIKDGKYLPGSVTRTLIDSLLDVMREIDIGERDYRLFNLVYIMKEVRKDLSDSDLSRLDLRHVPLYMVVLGRGIIAGERKAARVKGSKIGRSLLPQGHWSKIESVAYSSDGTRLLSGSMDMTLREWDRVTGECICMFEGHTICVSSVAYSPDGTRVLSGSMDHTIREWDRETGKCLRVFEGHDKWVNSVAYSNDGTRLLSGSSDTTIREWDQATGECLRVYDGHSGEINAVAYSPDEFNILSGGDDYTIREWDRETGEFLQVFNGHTSLVNSIVYSSDGTRVLSGSVDTTIREWDRATGECLQVFEGHARSVTSVAYSTDGVRVLSGCYDGTIREWDRATGECLRVFDGDTGPIFSISYSPDDTRLLSGSEDHTMREWDPGIGECLQIYTGFSVQCKSVNYRPDGSTIVAGCRNGLMQEWDRESLECVRVYLGHTHCVNSAVCSPDGMWLLSGSSDRTIREWDQATGECLRMYDGHSEEIYAVAYSPDGRMVLSGSQDTTIREWDRETKECLRVFEGHTYRVCSIAYSPDGARVLSGSNDTTIREWDREKGKCLRVYEGHTHEVVSVTYRPDGARVCSGSHDGTIREWDCETGECLRVFNGYGFNAAIYSISYSPDGTRVLLGNYHGKIYEWDCGTGECQRVYEAHKLLVESVACNPAGSEVLSAGWDGFIKEYDRRTGACMWSSTPGLGLYIQGVDFSDADLSALSEKQRKLLFQHAGLNAIKREQQPLG